MRIYNTDGEIPYRAFTFPDGQPHLEIQSRPSINQVVTIETAIRNPNELFNLLLAREALATVGIRDVNLDIRYLMAARMDRSIDLGHPLTLTIVAKMLRHKFNDIRVLDPHSSATAVFLGSKPVYPHSVLKCVLAQYKPEETYIFAPDAGSTARVLEYLKADVREFDVLQGAKKRNPETGTLSGFELLNTPADLHSRNVLILDDICDGGGTFVGQALMLRELGVKHVDLYVTHGIFSKGTSLAGIRYIWTTDSYRELVPNKWVMCYNVSMQREH